MPPVGARLGMMAAIAALMLLGFGPTGTQAASKGCTKSQRAHHRCKAKPKKKHKKKHSSSGSQHVSGGDSITVTPGGDGAKSPAPANSGPVPPANPAADPSAPCPDTTLAPTADDHDRLLVAIACLSNQQRAQNGIGALDANATLQKAGDDYSGAMVSQGFFSHTGPDGSDPTSRALAAGYADPNGNYWIGEDLAAAQAGADTPASLVAGWMNSPAHRAVILDDRYRDLGIGIADGVPQSQGGGPGTTYAAEFGVRGT